MPKPRRTNDRAHGTIWPIRFLYGQGLRIHEEFEDSLKSKLAAISTAARSRSWEYASAKSERTMKPRRLFILRYSSSPYDEGQEFFLALEEHLPGGTVVEFEADDVYRTFTGLNWKREHIEFLLYQRKSTVAETRRHATWMRFLKAVVQRIASIPAGEAFCVVLSSAVLVLSSGTSKKRRRSVRQRRDVFAETATAREQYEAARERNRAAREERRRQDCNLVGHPQRMYADVGAKNVAAR